MLATRFPAKLFLLFSIVLGTACAVEPLPENLIQLDSKEGTVMLKEDANQNTVKMLAHFTTQDTVTYCGVASAVMVLNSINIPAPVDPAYTPYAYFTQDNFFNDNMSVKPENVKQNGMTLSEMAQAIATYGVKATAYPANELSLEAFRKIATKALAQDGYVTVNFLRTALQEVGGGHHSPLVAYDKKTDRFLLLDVARYKYPAYWVKTEDLWKAINTMDGVNSRGFIVIGQ
ncbi:MAG: phytochelatin synthase family protein [Gammaproteobacteria bacterium]